jgi:hypothetical protein
MSFNRITDLTDVMEVRDKLQTASDSELREIRAQ